MNNANRNQIGPIPASKPIDNALILCHIISASNIWEHNMLNAIKNRP
jgi:hypothetical protein